MRKERDGAMLAVSLFSGIGGFDLGFERAGIETVLQVEWNAECRELLAAKFPSSQRLSDVRMLTAFDGRNLHEEIQGRLNSADVFCGGFPCQDLSVAGARAGLAGERSGLWFTFRRALELFRPPWVVIENVPGLLSSDGGRDLFTVLRGLADIGYWWTYRVLDCQFFGLAQRRNRIFIVASLGTNRCAQVLFEPESVCGNPAPGREAKQRVAPSLEARAGTSGANNFATSGGLAVSLRAHGQSSHRADSETYVAQCLTAHGRRQDAETETLIAHTLSAEGFDASEDGTGWRQSGDTNLGMSESGVPPVRTTDRLAIAFTERTRDGGRQFESQEDLAYALTNPGAGGRAHSRSIAERKGVRRLTPLECERLQGFPDGWTDGFSDSCRYRMLGNAVPVPVAEWIGKRITSCS